MPIQPTRPEAEEDGTLDAYAHLYDVKAEERDRIAADEAEKQARQAEDARLDSAITKEVEDRKKADEEIKGMIAPVDLSDYVKFDSFNRQIFSSNKLANKVGISTTPTIRTTSAGLMVTSVGSNEAISASYIYSKIDNSYKTNDGTIVRGSNLFGGVFGTSALLFTPIATEANFGTVKPSASILSEDGVIKLNPSIFSDGITATDAQVSADLGFIGEHLAGDGLYYDATDGLQVKVGDGLEVQNDTIAIDQDKLPLASASNRGCVKVGDGLSISEDGTLSATGIGGGTSLPKGMAPGAECNGVVAGTGLNGSTAYLFGGWIDLSSSYGPTYLLVDVARGQITTSVAFTSGTSITFTVKGQSSIPTRFIQGSCMEVSFGGEYSSSIDGYSLSVNNAEDTVTVTATLKADVPAYKTITFRIV